MKKTVMLIFGTRPEAIKMAPLVKAFQADGTHFRTVVCVTGQHREMLNQVLDVFHIVPQYDLHVMKQGQSLYDVTARVLLDMRDVLQREHPDAVLVHGDTTTSMASALAAFYQHIPVAHVEAGFRTNNILAPWPEELNRQMTARMAAWHFAPTAQTRDNLLREGIAAARIFVTGNTVIDALHQITRQQPSGVAGASARRMVLITGHRRENFGDGLMHLCRAIQTLAQTYPDVDFVYPVHPNPNVRQAVTAVFGPDALPPNSRQVLPNVKLIEPMDYVSFISLMARCTLVLTDSGGIQEEAPGLGKPVLVMRDVTERTEAVEAGTVKLVGAHYDTIVRSVSHLLDDDDAYQAMSHAVNPYGDGHACHRIVDIMCRTLSDNTYLQM